MPPLVLFALLLTSFAPTGEGLRATIQSLDSLPEMGHRKLAESYNVYLPTPEELAAAPPVLPLVRLPGGLLEIWPGFGADGKEQRAYLFMDSGVCRLLGWEEFQSLDGFGNGATLTVQGYRESMPVMDYITLYSVTVDIPRPPPLSDLFNPAQDPYLSPPPAPAPSPTPPPLSLPLSSAAPSPSPPMPETSVASYSGTLEVVGSDGANPALVYVHVDGSKDLVYLTATPGQVSELLTGLRVSVSGAVTATTAFLGFSVIEMSVGQIQLLQAR